ncbi:MAG TPA: SCO family protein, partial [Myxococcaceae bacterium]|nr:SCO family protein [Myxococcaceae bacterium]
MPRRVIVLATVAAALAVLAIELVIRSVATEPQALPASIRRSAARADGPLPTLWSVPAYRLVDQDGKGRTPEDLRGSVWVADLIFTSCKSI